AVAASNDPMKPIHVLGIILVPAFAMVWSFQIWSAGQWKNSLRDEGNGTYHENKRTNANVEAFAREAFNDTPPPVNPETDVSPSGSSWEEQLEKKIDHWVHA